MQLSPVRRRLFIAGWILLSISAVALVIAAFELRHMTSMEEARHYSGLATGGMIVSALSLFLLLFGGGVKRLLALCAFIEFYIWFSSIALW